MPLLRITSRKNAISLEQRRALAPLLTDIILEGEVDHATDAGRRAAHVLFAELDGATEWFTGGVPADEVASGTGLILFEVTYPRGAADAAEKSKLHKAINAAAVKVLVGADAGECARQLDHRA